MPEFEVRFYTGSHRSRQCSANLDGAICYVEHHLNSFRDPDVAYSSALITNHADQYCRQWAETYIRSVAETLNIPLGNGDGIIILSEGDRGHGNLSHATMPAMIPEPLFVSNPAHANLLRHGDAAGILAEKLALSIRRFFPEGGLVGFSVGHRYKDCGNMDEGAPVAGGGTEAEFAEMILVESCRLLTGDYLPKEQE